MIANQRARKLLSVVEVSAALSLSRGTVEKLIRDGRLKSISLGRRRLIDLQDLDELISNLKGQR